MMKFGFRKPSIRKRVSARTSWKRAVRHRMGLKMPRGFGWFTNPKKAAYNRVYRRTTKGCLVFIVPIIVGSGILAASGWFFMCSELRG